MRGQSSISVIQTGQTSDSHAPRTGPRAGGWWETIIAIAITLFVCVLTLVLLMRLWKADFGIPFDDRGDVNYILLCVKSLIDTGWYNANPYLGAPYAMHLYDLPAADNLSMAIMWLIARFTRNYAIVINLYFLATFPLTALCSLLALRDFGISYPSAIAVSLLFTFMPYHFMRNEAHLFLAAYYMVPLVLMVSIWIWRGTFQGGVQSAFSWRESNRRGSAAIIAVLAGCGQAYYVSFSCFLLLLSGAAVSIRERRARLCLPALILTGLIVTAYLLNLTPNLVYFMRHGLNPHAVGHSAIEAEVYGLRPTQMLLPVRWHRIAFLSDLTGRYIGGLWKVGMANENEMSSLGAIGALGFLLLAGRALFGPLGKRDELLHPLASLALGALLLGTVAGFGSLLALIVSPAIRSYDRISIYIGFLSLSAVALFLDGLSRKICTWRHGTSALVRVTLLYSGSGYSGSDCGLVRSAAV